MDRENSPSGEVVTYYLSEEEKKELQNKIQMKKGLNHEQTPRHLIRVAFQTKDKKSGG